MSKDAKFLVVPWQLPEAQVEAAAMAHCRSLSGWCHCTTRCQGDGDGRKLKAMRAALAAGMFAPVSEIAAFLIRTDTGGLRWDEIEAEVAAVVATVANDKDGKP